MSIAGRICVRVQWRMGDLFENIWFAACPREGEYVMKGDQRFRVCQVQYRDMGAVWAPHVILQRESS